MLTSIAKSLSSLEHASSSILLIRVAVGVYLVSSGILGGIVSIVDAMDPSDANFGAYAAVQIVIGALLIAGLFTRIGAIALCGLFVSTFVVYGLNALDQVMIFGTALALFFKGGSRYSLDCILFGNASVPNYVQNKLVMFNTDRLVLPSIRMAFGANLIWLGFTEKILAPDMFAAVMENFHVSPAGVDTYLAVFGAGFIELAIGMLYLLGIRMRVVSFLMFGILIFTVLTFHESALAHIIMFGISATFAINGKDPITLVKMSKMAPILKQAKNILLLRMYADSN